MKSLKEDGFTAIMEMFAANDIVKKHEPKDDELIELKVGDYYTREGFEDEVRRIYDIKHKKYYYHTIDKNFGRDAIDPLNYNNIDDNGIVKLNKVEIEQALIDESIKRGFVEDVEFMSIGTRPGEYVLDEIINYCPDHGLFSGRADYSGVLYRDGMWAEIIK